MEEPDEGQERRDFKAAQRKHWNAVATGWAAHSDWTEQNFAPLTQWLQTSGCWRSGSRVLDVACGSGYPAIAAAMAIGSLGRVVATDISSEMLAVSLRRAHRAGIDNVEFIEADAEKLQFDNDSFDAVTNTYGLMFCPDLERAVREMRRVLRPGGRAAIVVWDEPRNNPFFEVIFTAAAPLLALAPLESGVPGPFRLASPEQLAALLRGADLLDVAIQSLPMTFESESIDDYIRMFGDLALKGQMARLSAADRVRLRAAVAEVAQPHVDGHGGLRLQTTSLCATARK